VQGSEAVYAVNRSNTLVKEGIEDATARLEKK